MAALIFYRQVYYSETLARRFTRSISNAFRQRMRIDRTNCFLEWPRHHLNSHRSSLSAGRRCCFRVADAANSFRKNSKTAVDHYHLVAVAASDLSMTDTSRAPSQLNRDAGNREAMNTLAARLERAGYLRNAVNGLTQFVDQFGRMDGFLNAAVNDLTGSATITPQCESRTISRKPTASIRCTTSCVASRPWRASRPSSQWRAGPSGPPN